MNTSDFEYSEYAQFHLKFKGKFIKDTHTGKEYRKSVFFDKFRNSAKLMLKGAKCETFIAVDRPGWENGEIIDTRLFMAECDYKINQYTEA